MSLIWIYEKYSKYLKLNFLKKYIFPNDKCHLHESICKQSRIYSSLSKCDELDLKTLGFILPQVK